MISSRCLIALAALGACKDAQPPPPAPPPIVAIEVRDGSGQVVAELKPTRPCRAVIGPQEMIVGGPPIVSTLGTTKWTGDDDTNGTTFMRDDERIARLYPIADPASGSVFDMHGIAQARVTVTGQTAVVENKASVPVRRLTLANGTITADDPAMTITGTDDLVIAALLSAPELLPEVRMLAACERVLTKAPK